MLKRQNYISHNLITCQHAISLSSCTNYLVLSQNYTPCGRMRNEPLRSPRRPMRSGIVATTTGYSLASYSILKKASFQRACTDVNVFLMCSMTSRARELPQLTVSDTVTLDGKIFRMTSDSPFLTNPSRERSTEETSWRSRTSFWPGDSRYYKNNRMFLVCK